MRTVESDSGSVEVTYDSSPLAKLLFALGIILLLVLGYDLFIGSRGTDRAVALVGAAATCLLMALFSFEVSRFTFDRRTRRVSFRKRFGWSLRNGSIPFEQVQDVLVQSPIGDDGTPSRRVCLRIVNGKDLPLTSSYMPDPDNGILEAGRRIRSIVGLGDDPDGMKAVASLVAAGQTMDAIRLLRSKGLSLEDAKTRVDRMKGPVAGAL